MTEKKEFEGIWFLPSNKEEKLRGILSFHSERGSTLKLIGGFNSKNFNEEIIQGFANGGIEITLNKCTLIHPLGDTVYSVSRIFEGVLIDAESEIKFQEIASEIYNLNEWTGISGLKFPDSSFIYPIKEINISYKRPEPINFQINENFNGQFKFILNPISWGSCITEVSLKQRVEVIISSKNEYTLKTLLYYVLKFQNFLIIGLYKSTYPSSISLFSDNFMEKNYSDDTLKRKKIKLYYPISYRSESKTPISTIQMLFCYEDIKDSFSTIIHNWYEKYDLWEPVFNLLFEQFYFKKVLTNKFLNLAQAVESFHERTIDHPRIPEEENKRNKQEILALVPNKYHEWLKGQFNNYLFLETRLSELISKYPHKILDKIIDNKKLFVSQIKDSRNYYTHYKAENKEKAVSGVNLFHLSEKLKILLIYILLVEIGFDEEKLQIVLERYWQKHAHLVIHQKL